MDTSAGSRPPEGQAIASPGDRASHARADLDGFFDLAVDLLCVATTDGILLRVSRSWESVLGYPAAELVGRPFLDFVHPEDLPATHEAIARLDQGASVLNFVNRYRRRDGEVVWLEWRSSAPGGGLIYGVARDITERGRAEAELARINRLYAALSQVNQSIARLRSRDELFAEVTKALVESGGFAMSWIGWLDPATRDVAVVSSYGDESGYLQGLKVGAGDRPPAQGPTGTAIREERPCLCNDFLTDPQTAAWRDRAVRAGWRASAALPFRMGGVVCGALMVYGREPGWFGEREVELLEETALDLSFALDHLEEERQRRVAEEALRESEQRHRRLFEQASEGIALADAVTGVILDCNKAFERMTGYPRDELIGMPQRELHLPEDRTGSVTTHFLRHTGEGAGQIVVANVLTKGGEVREFSIEADVVQMEGRPQVLAFFQDVTEFRRAAEEVRASERRFRTLVEHASEAIIVLLGRQIGYVNQATMALLGADHPSQLIGTDAVGHVAPDWRPIAEERLTVLMERREVVPLVELEYVRIDGTPVSVEATGAPIVYEGQPAAVVFNRDITERKRIQSALREGEAERSRLETQLAQAQKMEAIGQLAGGVAHDFNNMLGVITGHAEMALLEVEAEHPAHESLEQILAAGMKSAELTKQLLAFARRQPVKPKVLDLNETVEGLLKMLRRLIGEGVDLRWQPAQGLWPVHLDPSQVDQVLANLVVNARDAMAAHGTITIETSNLTLDAAHARHAELQPGDYVRLAVIDTGSGMSPEVLAHVFEPFFTTKMHGRGTGLGLSTVYGIVKQNAGIIVAESEPGKGATFTIWFPRAAAADAELDAEAALEVPRGSEAVLVVEDEDGILSVTQSMLRRLGYRTLTARTPADAFEVAAAEAGTIDLLITDVIMPGMNGRELAAMMAERRRGIRCLFMSGYTADVIARHGVLDAEVHFLQKPFTLRGLAVAVRNALA